MQCETLFHLGNKWKAQLTKFFTNVLQNRFLQCSVHISLGHGGCFWKTSLRISETISWKLSSKTWSMWQHHVSQNSFFWKLWVIIRPLPWWQRDSLLLTGPGIYIHKFIVALHVQQYLFVRGSNEKQRKGRIIWNFTKGDSFSSRMTTKCSWG